MANLKVVAHLLSGFACLDDWSPDLSGLLEWLILDSKGLAAPNPSPEDVEASRSIVDAGMPIEKGTLGEDWYWKVSAPCYQYKAEYSSNFRKRWSPGVDSPFPNWGKRKAKWSGSEGHEKAYDLPNYVRVTNAVTWYAVGHLEGVENVLQGCTGIGKKRSHGQGQISRWEVSEVDYDWHLWGKDGVLMRPIPVCCVPSDRPLDYALRDWGWRPPAWLPSNKTRCAMPIHTCSKCP